MSLSYVIINSSETMPRFPFVMSKEIQVEEGGNVFASIGFPNSARLAESRPLDGERYVKGILFGRGGVEHCAC